MHSNLLKENIVSPLFMLHGGSTNFDLGNDISNWVKDLTAAFIGASLQPAYL